MIWDAVSGALLAGPLEHGSEVWFAQFDPRGERILGATTGHNVSIWSVAGELLAELPHGGSVSPTATGRQQLIQGWGCDPVEYAEFSPDGRLVTTAAGDRARVWDGARGKQLTELAHGQLVVMARFSPDGRRIITASYDGTAQLWDMATGLKLADPFRHDSQVVSAVFSANGRRIITASTDSTAKIWELPPVALPVPSWFPAFVESVAGLRLTSGGIPTAVHWPEREEVKSALASLPSTAPQVHWALQLLTGPGGSTPTSR